MSRDPPIYLLQGHYVQRMITQKFPLYRNRLRFNHELQSIATP